MSGELVAYSWNENSCINLDANEVGPELETLYDRFGHLTPDIVIDAAKDPGSAMHDYFEWDDAEAAHKYRKWQGRMIINSIRIVGPDDDTPRIMNVSVKYVDGGGRGYQKTTVAAKDQSMWDQVMDDVRHALRGAQKRMEDLIAVEVSTRRKKATKMRDAVLRAQKAIEENQL